MDYQDFFRVEWVANPIDKMVHFYKHNADGGYEELDPPLPTTEEVYVTWGDEYGYADDAEDEGDDLSGYYTVKEVFFKGRFLEDYIMTIIPNAKSWRGYEVRLREKPMDVSFSFY